MWEIEYGIELHTVEVDDVRETPGSLTEREGEDPTPILKGKQDDRFSNLLS